MHILLIITDDTFSIPHPSSTLQASLIMADTSSVLPRPSASQASNSISPSALHSPPRTDVMQYISTVGSFQARLRLFYGGKFPTGGIIFAHP